MIGLITCKASGSLWGTFGQYVGTLTMSDNCRPSVFLESVKKRIIGVYMRITMCVTISVCVVRFDVFKIRFDAI